MKQRTFQFRTNKKNRERYPIITRTRTRKTTPKKMVAKKISVGPKSSITTWVVTWEGGAKKIGDEFEFNRVKKELREKGIKYKVKPLTQGVTNKENEDYFVIWFTKSREDKGKPYRRELAFHKKIFRNKNDAEFFAAVRRSVRGTYAVEVRKSVPDTEAIRLQMLKDTRKENLKIVNASYREDNPSLIFKDEMKQLQYQATPKYKREKALFDAFIRSGLASQDREFFGVPIKLSELKTSLSKLDSKLKKVKAELNKPERRLQIEHLTNLMFLLKGLVDEYKLIQKADGRNPELTRTITQIKKELSILPQEQKIKRGRLEKKLRSLQEQRRVIKTKHGVWRDLPSKLPEILQLFETRNKSDSKETTK